VNNYEASQVTELELIHQGKVRDIFAIDDRRMLIVASDRLSAFDVILPDPIPGKGELLTQISNFWFHRTSDLVPNHLLANDITEFFSDPELAESLRHRTAVVQRLQPLPIEAIVRGYIIGSGWKDYQRSGQICGIALPEGLQQAQQLPEPIFTPSTKAAVGDHDENIDMAQARKLLGTDLAEQVAEASLEIYRDAAEYALQRGIIIADTKFEFGMDEDGQLRVMDEMLTPDSSRFWPQAEYRTGISPPSYDKQYIRDYLETLDWDKSPPGPRVPAEIIAATAAKYREACERLMQDGDA
jgi:phosphoribosylaminoimidazole-succinocarboxamide synthase